MRVSHVLALGPAKGEIVRVGRRYVVRISITIAGRPRADRAELWCSRKVEAERELAKWERIEAEAHQNYIARVERVRAYLAQRAERAARVSDQFDMFAAPAEMVAQPVQQQQACARKPWSAPVVVERFTTEEIPHVVRFRTTLRNADNLSWITRFATKGEAKAHAAKHGYTVEACELEPVYRLVSIPNPERAGSALDAVRLAVRDMSNTGESWPGNNPARDSYAPKPW
jgi:hypothetical protein